MAEHQVLLKLETLNWWQHRPHVCASILNPESPKLQPGPTQAKLLQGKFLEKTRAEQEIYY